MTSYINKRQQEELRLPIPFSAHYHIDGKGELHSIHTEYPRKKENKMTEDIVWTHNADRVKAEKITLYKVYAHRKAASNWEEWASFSEQEKAVEYAESNIGRYSNLSLKVVREVKERFVVSDREFPTGLGAVIEGNGHRAMYINSTKTALYPWVLTNRLSQWNWSQTERLHDFVGNDWKLIDKGISE